MMETIFLRRKLVPKAVEQFFPYTTMYGQTIVNPDAELEKIPVVKEIIQMTKKFGYQAKLEVYIHHKVLEIVCEYDSVSLYRSSVVVTYGLLNKKIIGCDICDSGEDSFFSNFVSELVEKYIEPIRDQLDIVKVLNEHK